LVATVRPLVAVLPDKLGEGIGLHPRDLLTWCMDRAMLEAALEATERHLAEAGRQVANQRERVAQLEREGRDNTLPTELLKQWEEALAMHLADRDRIRKELGDSE
jgi:hypothetical protein